MPTPLPARHIAHRRHDTERKIAADVGGRHNVIEAPAYREHRAEDECEGNDRDAEKVQDAERQCRHPGDPADDPSETIQMRAREELPHAPRYQCRGCDENERDDNCADSATEHVASPLALTA